MLVKARITVGARKETFTETSPDHFKISVREPAEDNMANRRVIAIIRDKLGAKAKRVKIVSGHKSPSKIISID